MDVVKKEFKDHVGEMENMRSAAREKHNNNSKRWTTFDDDDNENCHPNLFANNTNTLFDDQYRSNGNKLRPEPAFPHDQNPFWSPSHGSSMLT